MALVPLMWQLAQLALNIFLSLLTAPAKVGDAIVNITTTNRINHDVNQLNINSLSSAIYYLWLKCTKM